MKSALFVPLMSLCCHAGTFTHDTTTSIPLVDRHRGPTGQITFDISHTYDEDTFELVNSNWSWSADDLTQAITREVEISPAVFPDSPITETRTVTDTVRILDWQATSTIASHSSGPYFHDRKWHFQYQTIGNGSSILFERTIVGPLTTVTTLGGINFLAETAPIIHTLVNEQWEPPAFGYVQIYPNNTAGWIKEVTHDGIRIGGYFISAVSPVTLAVPEPSLSIIVLAAYGLLIRRTFHVPDAKSTVPPVLLSRRISTLPGDDT